MKKHSKTFRPWSLVPEENKKKIIQILETEPDHFKASLIHSVIEQNPNFKANLDGANLLPKYFAYTLIYAYNNLSNK